MRKGCIYTETYNPGKRRNGDPSMSKCDLKVGLGMRRNTRLRWVAEICINSHVYRKRSHSYSICFDWLEYMRGVAAGIPREYINRPEKGKRYAKRVYGQIG